MEPTTYIYHDRKALTDYKLLSGAGRLVAYKNGWPEIQIQPHDIVFSMSIRPVPAGGIRINTELAKMQATDKRLARALLTYYGVPVPKTWYCIEDAVLPYIARPRRHWLGKNFHVVRNQEQHDRVKSIMKQDWYFTALYPVESECRVMVWRDEIMVAYRKEYEGTTPEETVQERNRLRYLSRGGRAGYEPGDTIEITDRQKQICIDATKILGLDFAGIDMMTNGDDSVICEVNSAPTIRPVFADLLKAKINENNHIHKFERRR